MSNLEDRPWLAVADIASYYDNIDIRSLESDLRREGTDPEIRDLLINCLQRWSIFEGKGIPQAYNASHVLAKLYLNTFDEELNRRGFEHLRYNDDIRVFCQTRSQAREAIKKIFSFFCQRGLSLQSAKTEILERESAVQKINEVQELIEPIQEQQAAKMRVKVSGRYDDIFLSLPAEDIDAEVIREATKEHLIESHGDFSSTLFHYLINRLGKVGDTIAVEYCLSLLKRRPEETSYVLEYLERVGITDDMREHIAKYVASEDSVYDYQLYEIYDWFLDSDTSHIPNEALIAMARDLAFGGDSDFYLQNVARQYLGEYGVPSDLMRLQQAYSSSASMREQVVILASLRGREKSKRNGFYAGVKEDGWGQEEVVSLVKSES